MTADEYFNEHIPHRVNLLTTFRDRYSERSAERCSGERQTLNWDQPRDFFRCSKDISILMVRFFCEEMGLYLGRNESEPKNKSPWRPRFQCKQFTLADAKKDARFNSLVAMLKAANRAVAHINDLDVNHGFRTKPDHEPLFDVVDWLETLIQTHMYEPNRRSLSAAMRLENNDMSENRTAR